VQGNFFIKLSAVFCLLGLSTTGFTQSWLGSSAASENVSNQSLSPQDKATISQNSLDQASVGPDDCETRFPFPRSIKRDPYAENGAEICTKLRIRGQRMQCEVDSLLLEKPTGPTTTGSKIE